ncbi:hypothetical protein J2X05_004081 [Cellvibrio fibrivorans]|uniref:Uncharacterized protein n=1 Tax=Cellvibrio fibrivorans TaxID=126350 RepID=A0ABU1V3K2_9GAMM|nr:hypothetical protein [Cellvibrio fibrivorans]
MGDGYVMELLQVCDTDVRNIAKILQVDCGVLCETVCCMGEASICKACFARS